MRLSTADSGIRPLFGIVGRPHNVRPVHFDLYNLYKLSAFSKPHFHFFLLLYFYETGRIGEASIISQLSDQKLASLIIQTNYPSSAPDPPYPSLTNSAIGKSKTLLDAHPSAKFCQLASPFSIFYAQVVQDDQKLDIVSTNQSSDLRTQGRLQLTKRVSVSDYDTSSLTHTFFSPQGFSPRHPPFTAHSFGSSQNLGCVCMCKVHSFEKDICL